MAQLMGKRGFLRMAAKGVAGAAVVGGCAPETRASLDDLADLARSTEIGGALVTYPAACWNGALLKRGRIEQEIQMHKNMVALSNEFERPRYKRRLEELTKELEATPISELSKGDKEDFDKVKGIYGDRAVLKQIGNVEGLIQAIRNTGRAQRGLTFTHIGGHGKPRSIQLNEDVYLTIEDVYSPEFRKLRKYIRGPVLLSSCSTGKEEGVKGECIARAISKVWKTEVTAPIMPASTKLTPNLRVYCPFPNMSDLSEYGEPGLIGFLGYSPHTGTYQVIYERKISDKELVAEDHYVVKLDDSLKVENIQLGIYSPITKLTNSQKKDLEQVRQRINDCKEPFFKELVEAKKGCFVVSPYVYATYKNGRRIKWQK